MIMHTTSPVFHVNRQIKRSTHDMKYNGQANMLLGRFDLRLTLLRLGAALRGFLGPDFLGLGFFALAFSAAGFGLA
jgi:hypothetical protein